MSHAPSPEVEATWRELAARAEPPMKGFNILGALRADPSRAERYSAEAAGFHLQYSNNLMTDEILGLLVRLANESELPAWIEKMFRGDKINNTEDRAVLHTALRSRRDAAPVMVDGENIIPKVHAVLDRMEAFTNKVRSGEIVSSTGEKFTDVVHIGIGGSNLAPEMVCKALDHWGEGGPRAHFLANVDESNFQTIKRQCHPRTTLFIVASKTFTTQETMENAKKAKAWLLEQLAVDTGNEAAVREAVSKHFVAASANVARVTEFGIVPENMFEFWDWVGGRFSVWSSIGLPIALKVGMENFRKFLDGARAMDEHFRSERNFAKNIPVVLALIRVWYINFLNADTQATIAYDHFLQLFSNHLRQLSMESLGKSCKRDGSPVTYKTGAIEWGDVGTNSQHSFHQLLLQGTQLAPVTFLAALQSLYPGKQKEQAALLANLISQSEALLNGKTAEAADGALASHKAIQGNHPHNALFHQKLSPEAVGGLIALYEHVTFVQAVIWKINAFDQYGVELGKELAKPILAELLASGEGEEAEEAEEASQHDPATQRLIRLCCGGV